MRRAASILALALVLASVASAAERLSASLTSSRSTAVDARWKATLSVRRGGKPVRGARVVVVARRGGQSVAARARALRAGRYSARLRFASAGRWSADHAHRQGARARSEPSRSSRVPVPDSRAVRNRGRAGRPTPGRRTGPLNAR